VPVEETPKIAGSPPGLSAEHPQETPTGIWSPARCRPPSVEAERCNGREVAGDAVTAEQLRGRAALFLRWKGEEEGNGGSS
jgi:hypothetical protein